ncbi:hypothetical protein V6N12_060106 [Hibiscus sabdariffa]|uniref:RNase H type-1 domain-containing protein n=1 Tax=Hibiscus sabdariffa TaxID=183260 RepID=A0ABR2D3G5_9ROSI
MTEEMAYQQIRLGECDWWRGIRVVEVYFVAGLGLILGAHSSLAIHVSSAFAAEALATRCEVQFARELGLTRRLARHFQAFRLAYIHRSGNRVAHALANERFSLSADHALALVDDDRRCSEPP